MEGGEWEKAGGGSGPNFWICSGNHFKDLNVVYLHDEERCLEEMEDNLLLFCFREK